MKIASFLFASCSLAACGEIQEEEASEATYTGAIPNVEVVMPVKRQYESQLEITGTVEADKEVKVYSRERGFLRTLRKDIGDRVSEGDVLAILENPELTQLLKKAEASHTQTKSRFDRLDKVFKQTPALVSLADIEKAKADYETDKAERAAIQSQIGFLKVTAPFSGTVTARYVDKGALVQSGMNAGANPLFEIKSVGKLRLAVDFPESDLSLISLKTITNIEFPELPGKRMEGKISRMANALNPDTKSMRVEIDLDNKSGDLKPGMFANVKIDLKSTENALSVPKMALADIKKQLYVFAVRDNVVVMIPVKLGLEDKFFIEILDADLRATDEVIVQGKTLVSDGMIVKSTLKSAANE